MRLNKHTSGTFAGAGVTLPDGATENDALEFFNLENKASGLNEGVKIIDP